jgi:hypothetical protein
VNRRVLHNERAARQRSFAEQVGWKGEPSGRVAFVLEIDPVLLHYSNQSSDPLPFDLKELDRRKP